MSTAAFEQTLVLAGDSPESLLVFKNRWAICPTNTSLNVELNVPRCYCYSASQVLQTLH